MHRQQVRDVLKATHPTMEDKELDALVDTAMTRIDQVSKEVSGLRIGSSSNKYDYEVAPTRDVTPAMPGDSTVERCTREEATQYSVYRRPETGGDAEWLADCLDEGIATHLATALEFRDA